MIKLSDEIQLTELEFRDEIQYPIWYGYLIKSSSLIEAMVCSLEKSRRMQIAEYDFLDEKYISILSLDESDEVRSIIARRCNLCDHVIQKLYDDKSDLVRNELKKRKDEDIRRSVLVNRFDDVIKLRSDFRWTDNNRREFKLNEYSSLRVSIESTYRVLGINQLPHERMITVPTIRHENDSIRFSNVFIDTDIGTFPKSTIINNKTFNDLLAILHNINNGNYCIWKQHKRGCLAAIGIYDCVNKIYVHGQPRSDIKGHL